jgi:non-ribosomal peptide synthase protein (TIGR01720 family)
MSPIEDAYPLSPVQFGMLLHSIYEDSLTYVNQTVLVATGDLNVELLERAWHVVLARHPALRTAFVWEDLDEPVQVVLTELVSSFAVVRDGGGPSEEWLRADRSRGFDLTAAPLMRLTAFTSTPQRWHFVWTRHHLIIDAWSDATILDELALAYESLIHAEQPQLAPARPYRDYISWLARQDKPAAEHYWRQALAGFEPSVQLGHPAAADGPSAGGGFAERQLSVEATTAAVGFARTNGITFSTLVQGAFAILLSRYTGDPDVCFGVTSSGRPAEIAGIDSIVGMFLSTTPLRVVLSPGERSVAMLHRLQREQATARRFEYASLSEIQGWSPLGTGGRLFDVLLVMLNNFETDRADAALRLEEEAHDGQSNFALTVNAYLSDGRIGLMAHFDRARFGDELVAQLLAHLDELICRLAAGPQMPLGDLGWAEAQATETGVVTDESVNVAQLVQDFALKQPDAAAVSCDGRELSYAEVDGRAKRLAGLLAARGARPGAVVAIALERSEAIVVAALGVWYAGCTYVPLDPFVPAPVISAIIDDGDIALVVTNETVVTRFASLAGQRIVVVDHDCDVTLAVAQDAPGLLAGPAGAAALVSVAGAGRGSSLVTVSHRSLSEAALSLAATMALDPRDRMLDLDSRLDLSIASLFAPLAVGACVVLRTDRHLGAESGLREAVRADHVSAIVTSSTHWVKLVGPAYTSDAVLEGGRDRLRTVVVTGDEPIAAAAVERWLCTVPDVRLVRSFGPVEAARAAFVCDLDECDIAGLAGVIGCAAPGRQVDVRDQRHRSQPPWVPGVLHVDGAGPTGMVARRLPDGHIELLGRADGRADVGGHLVDVEEVRLALLSHPVLTDCAVVAIDGTPRRLIAYVSSPAPIAAAELSAYLQTILPDHAVPSSYVHLVQIPRSDSGRLVRSDLPDVDDDEQDPVAEDLPVGDVETVLAQVWARSLGVEVVGRHQNFFELGGDSIALIRVIGDAAQRGLRLTPRQVFENQTVATLAAVAVPVAAQGAGASAADDFPTTGPVPLLPAQHWFFEQQPADHNLWNTEFAFIVRAQPELVRTAVEAVMRHHAAFRLRFHAGGHGWQQEMLPEPNPDAFAYRDLSVLPAAQRDAAMRNAAWEAHRELDLTRGATARFVQFHRGDDQPDLLFVVVHHLIFDGVSSLILREDLGTALAQLARGESIALAPSTAYQSWPRRLAEYAAGDAQATLGHWRSLAAARPFGEPDAPPVTGEPVTEVVAISPEETRLLLKEIPAMRGASTLEVLLSALVHAMRGWTDEPFLVNIEGHGREDLFPDVEVTRTVGWFSSDYPVLLGGAEATEPAETAKGVRAHLGAVPNKGIDYGVLRYLGTPAVRAELEALPAAQIAFGYLGQLDAGAAPADDAAAQPPLLESTAIEAVVGTADVGEERYRSPSAAEHGHGAGIALWVEGGVLTGRVSTAGTFARAAQGRSLRDRYVHALREFIELLP